MLEHNFTARKSYVVETDNIIASTVLRFLSESELERINRKNGHNMTLYGIEYPLVGIIDTIETATKEELIAMKTVKAYEDTGNH